MLTARERLISVMTRRNFSETAQTRPSARFANASRRSLAALPLAICLITAIAARADSSCAETWLSQEIGLRQSSSMVQTISGIQGTELNFYGSSYASDAEITFKVLNYYSSLTPSLGTSKNKSSNNATTNDFGGGGASNTSTTDTTSESGPAPESSSVNSVLIEGPLHPDVVAAALTSNSTPTLNPVPEPRYSVLAVFLVGFSLPLWRKLQKSRRLFS